MLGGGGDITRTIEKPKPNREVQNGIRITTNMREKKKLKTIKKHEYCNENKKTHCNELCDNIPL